MLDELVCARVSEGCVNLPLFNLMSSFFSFFVLFYIIINFERVYFVGFSDKNYM